MDNQTLSYNTIVIGGGQAGLSTGYYLKQQRCDFIILDASERVGDGWRKRWDSLRLFTPACLDGLPGMPFPAPPHAFPTKDEMADYLESYAARFDLPIQLNSRVTRLSKDGDRFLVEAGDERLWADNVVVAMGSFQVPRIPAFAAELDPSIVQLHSGYYQNPSQLQAGSVLVVGAGNSGAEIAVEVARSHHTQLVGPDNGQVPFRHGGFLARHIILPYVIPFLGKHVLTMDTPMGRKVRSQFLSHGDPLVRTRREEIAEAGIDRIPMKVTGVEDGLPVLKDGRVIDVDNLIWCTGLGPSFSWIDLPVFGGEDNPREPIHERGVVSQEPGLYFVGLAFLYSMASGVLPGVARDAKYVVEMLSARQTESEASVPELPAPAAQGQQVRTHS